MKNSIDKEKSTLLVFTKSFPYKEAAEDTFLNPEIKKLCPTFHRIIIIPASLEGDRENIPQEIRIEESFSKCIQSKSVLKKAVKFFIAIGSPLFYKEIFRRPSLLRYPQAIRRLISFTAIALLSKKWIYSFIAKENFNLRLTLFYTYWFDGITMGIELVKSRYPAIKILSRAHGYDLYFERHRPPYIPFRYEALKTLDYLFFTSKTGRDYTLKKFPEFKSKYCTALLGVEDPGFITKGSEEGILRILSCSFMLPVKRLGLLIRSLSYLGKKRKTQVFEWFHIGDGPLENQLKDLAAAILPPNVTYNFTGYLPIDKIMEFYKKNRIDLFINVSQSEGLPVSIMEAQSCGIPVIATAVGGNPEIVDMENGILLNANPSPGEISEAVEVFLLDPAARQEKSRLSRLNWEKKFNAVSNFSHFAEKLKSLMII